MHFWRNAFRIPAWDNRNACPLPATYSEIWVYLNSKPLELFLLLFNLGCLQHLAGYPVHGDETSGILASSQKSVLELYRSVVRSEEHWGAEEQGNWALLPVEAPQKPVQLFLFLQDCQNLSLPLTNLLFYSVPSQRKTRPIHKSSDSLHLTRIR